MKIIDKGIFLEKSGVWWAYSFTKPDYVFSLHTKDEAKAQAKYDDMLANLRASEALYRDYRTGRKNDPFD